MFQITRGIKKEYFVVLCFAHPSDKHYDEEQICQNSIAPRWASDVSCVTAKVGLVGHLLQFGNFFTL